jgi:hypothetical protein
MPTVSSSHKILCPGCDRGMKLVQTIPQSGVLSEIVVFYCECCEIAETIAQKRADLTRPLAPNRIAVCH